MVDDVAGIVPFMSKNMAFSGGKLSLLRMM
jgi:hypothetical protein